MVSTARLGVVKQSSFGLSGQYGRRVTRANANEKTRGAPWQAGEFGEFVKIVDNLDADANKQARGAPRFCWLIWQIWPFC